MSRRKVDDSHSRRKRHLMYEVKYHTEVGTRSPEHTKTSAPRSRIMHRLKSYLDNALKSASLNCTRALYHPEERT